MEEIKAYLSKNGQIYKDELDAFRSDVCHDFERFYEDERLMYSDSKFVQYSIVLKWLVEHLDGLDDYKLLENLLKLSKLEKEKKL